jgi:hypothetical protein
MGNLVRLAVSVPLPLLSLLAWNAPAAAQQSTRGHLPVSLDLRKVPVGSLAEYRITLVGIKTPFTERLGLVARTASTVDLECEAPENEVPRGRKTVRTRLSISDTAIKGVEVATQWKDNDPRSRPLDPDEKAKTPYRRLDPKTRIGVESVTVPAGTFAKAEHYRVRLQGEETMDFWTSPDAPPLGLVKVVIKGSPGMISGSTRELVAIEAGAKPIIVKKPKADVPGEISPELEAATKEIERIKEEDRKARESKDAKKK